MKISSTLLSTLIFTSFIALSALVLSNTAQAEKTNASIEITNFYARATPPSAVNSAVFATISNSSNQDRILLSVSSNAAEKVELHDVIHEGDVMKMRQVPQIIIPAKQTVALKSGSLHIMLLNIHKPLHDGETIEVTLSYDNGEIQNLIVPVKKVMAGMHKHHH